LKHRGATREAGVSEVIGVVLIIGLAVTLIAVLQVSAVPVWNEAIEIDHSRQVQDEMVEVRESVLTTAGGGGTRSVSVKLGTGYPNRVVLRSPPDSTGTLRTVGEGQVSVNNGSISFADSNVGEFWNNVTPNLPTRALVYTPDYNEYLDAPSTGYENTVVYNQDGGEAALSDQTLVDGDVITIPVLNGTGRKSGSDRATIDLRPRSVSTDAVTISPDGAGPHFEIPTQLSQDTWDSLLGDEGRVDHNVDGGTLELTLTGGDYRLRMAEVSVDGSGSDISPAYLTKVDSLSLRDRIVVEVRDKYNNPLADAQVGVASGNCQEGARTTEQEGRAAFDCDRSQETVLYVNGNDGTAYEEVRVPDEEEAKTTADDPTVDSAVLERRTENFGQAGVFIGDQPVDVSQYTLDYTALSDQTVSGVGLEGVLITLRDTDDGIITSASNSLNGQGSYTGGWVSPWLRDDDIDGPGSVDALITVVDEEGNTYSCVTGIGPSGTCSETSPSLSGLSVSLSRSTIGAGESTTASATASFTDGSTQDVTGSTSFSSNDTGIATTSGSTVTGQGGGVARITGSYNGETDSETVRVRDVVRFSTLSATATERGNSGNIQQVELSGNVNNPDTNGDVRLRVFDGGSQFNSNSVQMSGSFSFNTGAGNRGEPLTIRADLLDGNDDVYQTCEAQIDASETLSLSDFSCSDGPAQ
jgi:hypothetical protein